MATRIRRQAQIVAAIAALASAAVVGSDPAVCSPADDRPTVKVCEIRLTEFGKRATFRVRPVYRLVTDALGRVTEMQRMDADEMPAVFIHLESLTACFREWVLEPSETYDVLVGFGTTGDTVYNITRQGRLWLRLVVPL
jgi:hypothetical protein